MLGIKIQFRADFARSLAVLCLLSGYQLLQGAVTPTNDGVSSVYADANGSVQYLWTAPAAGSQNSLGNIHVVVNLHGSMANFNAPLELVESANRLTLQSASISGSPTGSSALASLKFAAGSTPVTFTLQFSMSGKTLWTDMHADQAVISKIASRINAAGSGGTPVKVPYYLNSIQYYSDSKLFSNGYFDWQYSHAGELDPMQTVYHPLTDGSRPVPTDRLVLSFSDKFADVLPAINNAVSTYRAQVAGRTVIDIWSQANFWQISQQLAALKSAGVKNCVVLIHTWQQSGYDNALPATYPAEAAMGGNPALADAIAAGRNIGCYVGVHENYNDYYPNYFSFSDAAVGKNSEGSQILGWRNSLTNVQSYATKQTSMVSNARVWSPQIHQDLTTNASFVDVASAAVPDFHVDMDASQPGAGTMAAVLKANTDLWNFQRQTHGGPVFGEGQYHWYWSGLLDGVEAQFGASNFVSAAEKNPLFVDFDLLKIHPLQVNHGMGMYERWLTDGEDIARTDLNDAYRMQEVIFGHAPYIGDKFWSIPSRVLLEQNLVSPVAQRYGTQSVTGISYQVNGTWTSSEAATGAGDWSRVRVQYGNGDTIVANNQATSLKVSNRTLPQYGWLATGTNLLAYTASIGSNVVDYAQTATSYFANARNQMDLKLSGLVVRPSVTGFRQTQAQTVSYTMQWQVLDGPQGTSLLNFVHFVDQAGNIAFQGDYAFGTDPSQWRPGQVVSDTRTLVIPPGTADGTYSMRAGLFSSQSGLRTQAYGTDDGTQRYILGTVTISKGVVTFSPQAAPTVAADARLNGAGSLIDFGAIRTDGMASLKFENNVWTAMAYPQFRNVVVRVSNAQVPRPPFVSCNGKMTAAPAVVNGYWQIPINGAASCTWPKP